MWLCINSTFEYLKNKIIERGSCKEDRTELKVIKLADLLLKPLCNNIACHVYHAAIRRTRRSMQFCNFIDIEAVWTDCSRPRQSHQFEMIQISHSHKCCDKYANVDKLLVRHGTSYNAKYVSRISAGKANVSTSKSNK